MSPPSNIGAGDEYLSPFAPAMNPSNADSPIPASNAGSNAEMAAANGAQSNSGSATGREGSYVPQFSAATEMILRRMRGEPTGEFDPSSSPNVDGWEEAKAKVMMGMKTTMNMDMGPMPQNASRRGSAQRAAAASRAAASRAASRRASSTPGPATGGTPSASTPVASGSAGVASRGGRATPTSATRGGRGGRGSATKGGARGGRAGGKRKRQVKEESESAEESDNMSKLGDDSSDDDGDSVTNMPSMTSSGRQIQKPKSFNPVAMDGPPRKRAAPKKIQEQALCKRCGRGHSPQSNMIVFCDGCNMGWHQMCHDPVVSDEVVKDESSEWFCAECTAEREEKLLPSSSKATETVPVQTQLAQEGHGGIGGGAAAAQEQQTFIEQQQRMEASSGVSGIGKSMEEKRAYLSMLPHPQLVALLLHATTLHPDLPIFPPSSQHFLANQSSVIPAAYYTNQSPQPYGGGQPLNSRFPQQPHDRRTNVYPQQPFPPSAASGLFSRAEANPNAPINFIRKIPSGGVGASGSMNGSGTGVSPIPINQNHMQQNYALGVTPQPVYPGNPYLNQSPYSSTILPSQTQNTSFSIAPTNTQAGGTYQGNMGIQADHEMGGVAAANTLGNEAEGEGESSRESTPASPPYPRPGNGLMRKLPPDDQDLEWLEDHNDYEAFSHVVYDGEGRGEKVEEDGVVLQGVGAVL